MFQVAAPITMDNAPAQVAAGEAAIAQGERQFSLAATGGSDSSAVAACVQWVGAAQRAGATLAFEQVPVSLASLAVLYGVAAYLPGFPHATVSPPNP